MSDYTPTTEEVRQQYVFSDSVIDGTSFEDPAQGEAEFDRWLAQVELAAAEKAWNRCVGEMPIDPDWKNFYSDNNPYREETE